jgi:hypothetical protein
MTISHANNKRSRSVVRLDRKAVGADALSPATNKQYTSSVYLVVDYPFYGVSDATLDDDINGLCDFIQTGTNIAKILGQES